MDKLSTGCSCLVCRVSAARGPVFPCYLLAALVARRALTQTQRRGAEHVMIIWCANRRRHE